MTVSVSKHPLIQDKISQLRDANTDNIMFKRLVDDITLLLCYEGTQTLTTHQQDVTTPIEKTQSPRLTEQDMMIVPILRAGLSMVEGMSRLLPNASIGHIGLKRDEETLLPTLYFKNLPLKNKDAPVFVCDPMLATGGSAVDAIKHIKQDGFNNIHFICILAAPEGVKHLSETFPELPIHIGFLDKKLNDKGYIVPGLGDAGDRLYGGIQNFAISD